MSNKNTLSEDNSDLFYGQNGEDYLLWEFFEHKSSGFFVDIGAFDGIHLSNSYVFEKKGWHGICVEPHPDYFPICKENRPQSICLNAACVGSSMSDRVEFFAEESGLFSGINSDSAREFISTIYDNDWNREFSGFDIVSVPALSLNAILAEHLPSDTTIDFLSIDTEGNELQILRGFDLQKFQPRVIVVETNTDEIRVEITEYMQQQGYSVARIRFWNTFFVHQDSDIPKLSRIPVRYMQDQSLHPLGEAFTFRAFRTEALRDDSEQIEFYRKELQRKQEVIQQQQESLQQHQEVIQQQQESLQQQQESLQQHQEVIQQQQEALQQQQEALQQQQEINRVLHSQHRRLRKSMDRLASPRRAFRHFVAMTVARMRKKLP